MANCIKTKYSDVNIPEVLETGELAWSNVTKDLYIGDSDGNIIQMYLDSVSRHLYTMSSLQTSLEFLFDTNLVSNTLSSWLVSEANQHKLKELCRIPAFIDSIISNQSLFSLLVSNTICLNILLNSPGMLQAIVDHQASMEVVWSSNTGVDLLWSSTLAKMMIWKSDAALAALQKTPTQISRQIGLSNVVVASTSDSTQTFVPIGQKVILLRRWITGNINANEWISYSRNGISDATLPNNNTLNSGSNPAKGLTTTYTDSEEYPSENTSNANCVCALNGLKRSGSNTTSTMYLIYLLV